MPRRSPPIAADYRRQVAADLLVITNRTGGLLAAVPAGAGAPTPSAVAAALGGREVVEFRPDAGGVSRWSTVPIAIGLESPDLLGTLSLGVRLDDAHGRRGSSARHGAKWPSRWTAPCGRRLCRLRRGPLLARRCWRGPMCRASPDRRVDYVGRCPAALARDGSELRRWPRRRAGGARVAVAHRALGIPAHRVRGPRPGPRCGGTAGHRPELCGRAHVTRPLAAITAAMREMAATGDLTRKIPLREPSALAGRGRAAAGHHVQHAHRLDRAVSARSRAARTSLALGRLSTVVAHEVRNPLMIIKARPAHACGRTRRAADIAKRSRISTRKSMRLNRIVHDVLDFAQSAELDARADQPGAPVPGRRHAATVGQRPASISTCPARPLVAHRSRTPAHCAGQCARQRAAGRRRARQRHARTVGSRREAPAMC